MSERLQEFLTTRLPFPALAAWSTRWTDRTVTSQSFMEWAPIVCAEKLLPRLTLAAEGLRHHDIQPRRLCWIFEHARFYLGIRNDGICLMLIVHNLRELSTASVDSLMDEFVGLDGS
jgi:hypothetical protein